MRCEACKAVPGWRIDRRGDAAVAWSCDADLAMVCTLLQRSWEQSELVVRPAHGVRIGPPQTYPAGEQWAP